MTADEQLRLLLDISEAANSQLALGAVLEEVARALAPSIPVDGVGLTLVDGDKLQLQALYIPGVERHEGDTFADVMARWLHLTPEQLDHKLSNPLPLAGTATEHIGETGRPWICVDLERDRRFPEDERLLAAGVRAYVRVPLRLRDRPVGSLLFARKEAQTFPPEVVEVLELLARPISAAVANAIAFGEISRRSVRLEAENLALRQEIEERNMFEEIVGSSKALLEMLRQVDRVAGTEATVLISGETGTGKELVARAIHRRSRRAGRSLVAVNCAALPTSLIASELFGHEKGAFTGALQRRAGRFELASGGTIFLDEIGELPLEVQASLLRVLQEGTFERVGGAQPIQTDVRVLAATNRDLARAVEEGTFRRDLYYRLNVFPLALPPLRERPEDIPILVEYFSARYAARLGKRFASIEKRSMDRILAYPWPGNVRELQNVIERAAILSDGAVLQVDEPLSRRGDGQGPGVEAHASGSSSGGSLPASLREQERRQIEDALAKCGGRVSGEKGAAGLLGLPATTLDSRIKSLGIDKRRFRPGPGPSPNFRRPLP